ncbi:MAG: hypothetical protein IKS49_00280 [Actinomycetaceae bacterium]|nr:hypothetical protein [Actinomycetaceae bacterium]
MKKSNTNSYQLDAYAENSKKGKKATRAKKAKLSEREKRAETENLDNLERDLSYAKSEIGTIAGDFLKGTPFPRRIAGIGIAVVLALGIGVAVGVHQIHSAPDSGSGIVEVKPPVEETKNDENTQNDDDTQNDEDTQNDDVTDEEETSTESDNNNADDTRESDNWSHEEYIASKTQATFTKGADGIYRAHIDAVKVPYRETWASEYAFEVPAELHKPDVPYVLHAHTQRRADVWRDYAGLVDINYSHDGKRYGDPIFHLSFRQTKDWESAPDVQDFYMPFFQKNSHIDEELATVIVDSRGVDVDIELMPASTAPLRTWDGHSKLEQNESELFRVTGPITAKKFSRTGKGGSDLYIYGWRPGDTSFNSLVNFQYFGADTIDLSGKGTKRFDGVELLWVGNGSPFVHGWSIQ